MKRFLLLGITILIISLNAHNNESIRKIEDAFQSGQITYENSLLQKLYYVFDKSKLESEFESVTAGPVKCATHLVAEFKKNEDQLSFKTQQIIESYIKPNTESKNDQVTDKYISPYEKFEVTYSVTGTNGVPSNDSNNSGVPDYVENIADYFDHSWKVLIDTLGFKSIPLDPGEYYQISFEDMGAYGYTTWNNSSAGTEIVMHNTYQGFPPNDDPDGDVLGAAKVTAVHEFKHAIQYLYNNWGEPGWFIEADATWSEDIGYDATNDYYNYLSASQIRQPGRSLFDGDGYEDNLFFHFFTEKYDINTNTKIWERREIFNESVYSSINNVLSNYGAIVDEAFAEYYVWLFNTGNQYDSNLPGYGEAGEYPNPSICKTISNLPSVGSGCSRGALSGNFLIFNSQNQNQFLQILLDTPNGNNYAGIITKYSNGTVEIEYNELNNSSVFELFVDTKLNEIDQVIVVLAATSTSGSNFAYQYTFESLQTAQFSHTPFNDMEVLGDLDFVVNVETPLDLAYPDSLRFFYQLNGAGYQSMVMNPTGNLDEYVAVLQNPGNNVQIDYYFRIADQLGQQLFHPESAPDSVFSFFIGSDGEAPEIAHSSLLGTSKFNFPLPVYANISDNISLDSTYIEYRLNEGEWVKQDLILLKNDLFYGKINFTGSELEVGDLVDYRIVAVDSSFSANKTQLPATDYYRFDVIESYYFSSEANKEIVESVLFYTSDTISVKEEVTINDLNIYFESDHPSFSEIYIKLYSPSGDVFILYEQNWSKTANASAGSPMIIFDQEAFLNVDNAILQNNLYAEGTFAPVDSDLSLLNGTAATGEWRIRVYDRVSNDAIGNLVEWGLIVQGENLTSVDEEKEELVSSYELFQNYPNPFNPSTEIKYEIPEAGNVSIKVYDILGNEVAELVSERLTAGQHTVEFNSANYGQLSSGIYFVRMASQNFTDTKKIMLVK